MLDQFRKDDVVVVTKLDRLARSTAELLRISEALIEKGAGIQSLDKPWADTTSPAGKMILTIFGGIAEFERSLILARTEEGRKAAMARGVAFGRPAKLRDDQKEVVHELVNADQSTSSVARTFDVHVAALRTTSGQDRSAQWSQLTYSRVAGYEICSMCPLSVDVLSERATRLPLLLGKSLFQAHFLPIAADL